MFDYKSEEELLADYIRNAIEKLELILKKFDVPDSFLLSPVEPLIESLIDQAILVAEVCRDLEHLFSKRVNPDLKFVDSKVETWITTEDGKRIVPDFVRGNPDPLGNPWSIKFHDERPISVQDIQGMDDLAIDLETFAEILYGVLRNLRKRSPYRGELFSNDSPGPSKASKQLSSKEYNYFLRQRRKHRNELKKTRK